MASETSLAQATDAQDAGAKKSLPWQTLHWQKLWLATQTRAWRSLAIVPASVDVPDTLVDIAEVLARTGMSHLGKPIRVVDATRVSLSQLVGFTEQLRRCVEFGDLVFVVVRPTDNNPVAVQLAQAADAAILCVAMRMKKADAVQRLEAVGRARFVGSIILESPSDPTPPTKKEDKQTKKLAAKNGAA